MPTVNMLEARSNLSRLVEAVETGAEAEIIIASGDWQADRYRQRQVCPAR